MTDTGSAQDMRHLGGPGRGPTRSSPNLSGGWVVMVLSGLIAAVLFIFATQQSSNRVDVAVLSRGVTAGQVVDGSFFVRASVAADDAQLQRLISFSDRENFDGYVASGPFAQGDLIPRSALLEPAASQNRRSMSIPVEKTHANNGDLRAGDRIDVIDPDNPDPYVARNVEVISTQDSSGGGGIGSVGQFTVVAAVNDDQAVKVSQAIRNGNFDLVRTTGATPAPSTSTNSSTTSTTSTTVAR